MLNNWDYEMVLTVENYVYEPNRLFVFNEGIYKSFKVLLKMKYTKVGRSERIISNLLGYIKNLKKKNELPIVFRKYLLYS